ncbi:phosphotransferase [Chroococcus sp. FPU101]|uniref:phosphotransferase n=1 Tax=Chroococcus sp. FPU101 TaxID=1974212 RepID=UPI001A8C4888|nr:phosphotransferase [Chroococcus sp. FPU101]GFE68856.1 hypothetical protein CFPU101_14660 [Chroococcus sp. FPU101]
MEFVLNTQNVFDYLVQQGLCTQAELNLGQVELKTAKNFNLLLELSNARKLLVKQERPNKKKTRGELVNEWRFHEFLEQFSELNQIRSFFPEILHFNVDDSVIVLKYFDDYCDLSEFYAQEKNFDTEIATLIGTLLATIHRTTFEHQAYQNFFEKDISNDTSKPFWTLGRLTPEIFGHYSADILKFFSLYQRYNSLTQAIADLTTNAFNPCCLVHNDLKLNNILLHVNWEQTSLEPIRLIDWERCSWGDPAFDLGTLIASYLGLWLGSLVVSTSINLEESLRLAMIPLEELQPLIAALTVAYLKQFPQILASQSDFLHRVIQFTGLALIQQIQSTIQYQKAFNNTGICTLQVAKSLLCNPVQSISTVFGQSESELIANSCLSI